MQHPPMTQGSLDDRVSIQTPEGLELHMVLAGLGSRFVAALLDILIKTAVTYALLFVMGGTVAASGAFLPTGTAVGVALGIVLVFLVQSLYDIAFEVLAGGKTPGKRWSGLRVVMSDGGPVTFRASAVRNLLRVVDFLPAGYIGGITSLLVTRHNQRIGDVFAGTFVIRERTGGRTATNAAPVPTSVDPAVTTWDLSAIDPMEVATIKAFLGRRDTLAPHARAQLAQDLADRIYPKVGGAPRDIAPETLLETIVAAKATRG